MIPPQTIANMQVLMRGAFKIKKAIELYDVCAIPKLENHYGPLAHSVYCDLDGSHVTVMISPDAAINRWQSHGYRPKDINFWCSSEVLCSFTDFIDQCDIRSINERIGDDNETK